MATTAELAILVKARDDASRHLNGIGKSAGRMGSALKTAALAGGLAVAGLGAAALKFAGDFNDAFETIRTQTGATGETLEGLEDSFKTVLGSLPTDMKTASAAIASFNTALGATGSELEALTFQAVAAADVLGEDTARVVEAAGQAFNSFGLSAVEGTRALDGLFVASQQTGVPLAKLLTLLNEYGPVLNNLGLSLTESAAFFAQLEKAGISVSRVMPGLNAFMRKLAEEGVEDLSGALQDTIEQIRDAESSSKALNLATEAFGAEGAQRLVVAVRNGALEIDDLVAAMDGATGAIAETERETRTWQESLTLLKNNILIALEPALTSMFQKLNQATNAFRQITMAVMEALRGGESFEDMLAEMSPTMRDITRAIVQVVEFIRDEWIPAFKSGLDAFRPLAEFIINNKPVLIAAIAAIGLAIVVALGPGAAAVAAIVGLISLIGFLRNNWDEIKQFFIDAGNQIIDFFKSNWPEIATLILLPFAPVVALATDAFGIRSALENAFNAIIEFIRQKVNDFVSIIKGIPGRIAGVAGDIADAITPDISIPGIGSISVPGFQHGTPYVPRTGLAMLHRGEAVIPAHANTFGAGGGLTVIVNVQGSVIEAERDIERIVRDVADRGGFRGSLVTR